MTLHAAIQQLLEQFGRPMTTQEIADYLNDNLWYQKKDKSKITSFQIHGRTKNYPHLFYKDGANIALIGASQKRREKATNKPKPAITKPTDAKKDEHYVLDIFDKVLGETSSRQHKFSF